MKSAVERGRKAKDYVSCREEIDKWSIRVIGISFKILRRVSPEGLLTLMNDGTNGHLKSIFLAELLIQSANLSDDEGNYAEAIAATLQAYYLLKQSLFVLPSPEEQSYQHTLQDLASKLEPLKEIPYIRERLLA